MAVIVAVSVSCSRFGRHEGPGLDSIMIDIGRRFEIAGRAARAGQFELAEFEANELEGTFRYAEQSMRRCLRPFPSRTFRRWPAPSLTRTRARSRRRRKPRTGRPSPMPSRTPPRSYKRPPPGVDKGIDPGAVAARSLGSRRSISSGRPHSDAARSELPNRREVRETSLWGDARSCNRLRRRKRGDGRARCRRGREHHGFVVRRGPRTTRRSTRGRTRTTAPSRVARPRTQVRATRRYRGAYPFITSPRAPCARRPASRSLRTRSTCTAPDGGACGACSSDSDFTGSNCRTDDDCGPDGILLAECPRGMRLPEHRPVRRLRAADATRARAASWACPPDRDGSPSRARAGMHAATATLPHPLRYVHRRQRLHRPGDLQLRQAEPGVELLGVLADSVMAPTQAPRSAVRGAAATDAVPGRGPT